MSIKDHIGTYEIKVSEEQKPEERKINEEDFLRIPSHK